MSSVETLGEYYKRTNQIVPSDLLNPKGNYSHFNVQPRHYCNKVTPYNRRDHYKICLNIGAGRLRFADKTIEIDQPALVLSNPSVLYSWESIVEEQKGYLCLFNDSFISAELKKGFELTCPLFNPLLSPVCFLNQEQTALVSGYYQQMIDELKSDYEYKFDVIRSLLKLIIHQGIKIQSEYNEIAQKDASDRITPMFMELLERQFPVDSPGNPLKIKSASEFASQLNIHVNHLNYVVKSHTGKTTTQMISNRIVDEAKTLLKNTDWDVAEIGYCLGFDYPAHFNNYFKKHTGITPSIFKYNS
ncbi:AraC-like DNA-binding protein [Pedobacter cryoconitis]|uniref:AraC-like DNA-binding protein n=1 Tax=Pedobacter cryoconitis TaxID=188932 RepID=A0A7W8ZPV9_9SPHI|nr:helix-turn-helix domain-containing protein [Pedobacter cryoconitis]MBB5637984.1 AraC-like DNA-binding protein [Pedobacter cryoconitis]MBB6270928.1 AraC-like DNA-binding protein [Pedobacter cryoconitis]